MKKAKIICFVFLSVILCVSTLSAQTSLKGMSLNGSTGLYSIPSGRIGWERSSNFGLDFGYHSIVDNGIASHIPAVSMSLFKWLELSAAFDTQSRNFVSPEDRGDFLTGAKIQLPLTNTALALGGNFQLLNLFDNRGRTYYAGQVYAAVTYAGHFFDSPAETTVVVGKTFIENSSNSNIDFGMGFDLVLLPKQFGNLVHWVTDFANFSYSVEAIGADARFRGVLNTGLRIDLSVIPPFNRFKFVVDVFLTDAFDSNRAFSAGVVFGIPLL